MTRRATANPASVGAKITRGNVGEIDEPSSSIWVHSIAMRKQTTAKPERIPIKTARNKKKRSSRMVKTRFVQLSHIARIPDVEVEFADSFAVDGITPGEVAAVGSVTVPKLLGCVPRARARDQRLPVLRRPPPKHFPFRTRDPSLRPASRDVWQGFATSRRRRALCFQQRLSGAAFVTESL